MLEPFFPDVVGWELDAWLVLHDDLRNLLLIRLVADNLTKVLVTLLRTEHMPIQQNTVLGAQ